MDLIDAIRVHRVDPCTFQPEPVRAEHLKLLIEAAARSPSHFNSQPWRFVLLRDAAIRQQIAELFPAKDAAQISSAPTLLVAALNKAEYKPGELQGLYSIITLGAVVQTFSLVAASLNIGLQLIECTPQKEAISNLLGIPETFELIVLFAVGYLATPQAPNPPHDSLEERVSLNSWAQPLSASLRNAASLLWNEETIKK